jgi:CBS domain containing-hemolysin-like protein
VLQYGDYKFTVADLGDRRVAKVKVERIADRSPGVKEPVKASPK